MFVVETFILKSKKYMLYYFSVEYSVQDLNLIKVIIRNMIFIY